MVNRLKEEENSERAIRNLVKLPGNRRCINCNNLGPQYVCTTFLTFVCSNCSGVHREFTHRIKSISMAKFTGEEVSALQAGGNDRARQIYFKEWDPHRHSYPDSSNLHRLRDFIKHVYVNRKYSGERSIDTLPRLRLNGKESPNESGQVVAYRGGLKTQSGESKHERHYSEAYGSGEKSDHTGTHYCYDERRSPRYSQENSRYGGYRRSFTRIEIVDDRIRDDSHKFSKREANIGSKSPENQNTVKRSSSTVVSSLKDILRENIPPTKLIEDLKANNQRDVGDLRPNQDSFEGSSLENKECNSKGLIDFSVNSEPVVVAASSQSPKKQVPVTKTLEQLLLELSVPSTLGPSTYDNVSVVSGGNMPTGDATLSELNMPMVEVPSDANIKGPNTNSDGITVPTVSIRGGDTTVKTAEGQQLPRIQQQTPVASSILDGLLTQEKITLPVGGLNLEISSLTSNSEEFSSCSTAFSNVVSQPAQDTNAEVAPQSFSEEAKSSERKELPADLFTVNLSPVGWQMGLHPTMGYNLHYRPNMMPMPSIANSSRSTNPFDLNDEVSVPNTLPVFLEGALPQSFHSSGFQTHYLGSMGSQSPSNVFSMSPEPPSFAALSLSSCTEQQVHTGLPQSRAKSNDGAEGIEGAAFQSLSLNTAYSAPGNPSPLGGNPFG